jgi:hypothetical protein
MTRFCSPLAALLLLLCLAATATAQTRTVFDSKGKWGVLGGPKPRSWTWQIPARPGELAIISIFHGGDDTGDKGMHWRVVDENGNQMGAGFANTADWQTWKVRITGSKPRLVLEDKDTSNAAPNPGNGMMLRMQITK